MHALEKEAEDLRDDEQDYRRENEKIDQKLIICQGIKEKL
jgi:hypothetical protein